MCHGYIPRDTTDETPEERPSFPNEERSVDIEILTDGGDETERTR